MKTAAQHNYLERRFRRLLRCLDDQLNSVRLSGKTRDYIGREADRLLDIAAAGLAERLTVYLDQKKS